MLAAQTALEFRLQLRNAEQVGLTLVIPLLLLVFFNLPLLYSLDADRRIDFVVPSIIALAVMSAAFTGLAIGTGFERKYAVLKRLGATALPRSVLVGGKTLATMALELVQVVLICALGFALAWHPHGDPLLVLVLVRARYGCIRRARPAARRHGARRGDARRSEPDLAGAAVRRRHRDPAVEVPERRRERPAVPAVRRPVGRAARGAPGR